VKLAVYLPALNEAQTIGDLLDAIPAAIPGVTGIATIVIDDGSTDQTAAIAARHGARVVRHPRNLGTGRAFMSGVQAGLAADADIIVSMDADGQFAPADIPRLIAPIVSGEADVVLCTRFGPNSRLSGRMRWSKRFGNELLCRIISLTTKRTFTDVSCGFRAFTRDAALRVDIHSDFEYIHESLLTWHRFGQRVVEVELPVKAERATGESRVVSSVTDYGLRATPVLIGAIRDYSPLKFFGSLALLAFVPSILIGIGVFVHWWRTSETAPYTSFITVSVGGVLLGVLLGAVAMLADLIARLKFQVEEVLHTTRRLRGRS
jgi:glycosyltransferase involved in cell wall biosynthesis